MKNWKLMLGAALVLAAAAVVVFFSLQGGPGGGPAETVSIRYGSEKKGLLHDETFRRILKDRYNIQIDGVKMGSLEMTVGAMTGLDGLWPSSELAAQLFDQRHPDTPHKSQNIFNSPIVLYSWPEVTDALVGEGIVEKRNDLYYVVDMPKYLRYMVEKRTWKSLGLPRQNGFVSIHSTDPRKSNSGFLLTGLMAVIFNNGEMVGPQEVEAHLDKIVEVYQRMGYLENSTGTLFDKYVKQGQGAYPVISAYESLIIEFYQAYPDYRDQIQKQMRVLIPEPTVWSEHPFIALTDKGEILMEALRDPEVQKLAWTQYGLRSGVLGVKNDPSILAELNLPETIDLVAPLPSPEVMAKIINALK